MGAACWLSYCTPAVSLTKSAAEPPAVVITGHVTSHHTGDGHVRNVGRVVDGGGEKWSRKLSEDDLDCVLLPRAPWIFTKNGVKFVLTCFCTILLFFFFTQSVKK